LLIVPISLHSTGVSCRARLLLLRPASFPVFNLHLLARKVGPDPFSRSVTTGIPDGPLFFSGIAPSEVLADGAPSCPSYGLHCCFPPMVKRFRLSLSSFPESFRLPKHPDYLSAFRLNLPKNTLRWMMFVGSRRFYPSFPGSGSPRKQAFTRMVRSEVHLSPASLSLTF